MREFRDLIVWQRSHQLTLAIYEATGGFPKQEIYGLTSQLHRASASIPTNIAEGCGRDTEAELAHFMVIGMGSASEVEYELLLAYDLGYLDSPTYNKLNSLAVEVKKMPSTFIKKLQSTRR